MPLFIINCDIHKNRLDKFKKYVKKSPKLNFVEKVV